VKKLLVTIVTLLTATAVLAGSPLPEYKGPINDLAGILNPSDIQQLTSKILQYREQSGHEIGVLIVPTLGDNSLEDYAHDVFKAWGIGQKDKDDGVLFLVAIQEKKARVEVGYGLEGELTDLESGRLVNKQSPMAQHFRQGDFAGGVGAVIDGIITAIGGDYNPPKPKDDGGEGSGSFVPFIFVIFFILLSIFRRKKSITRRFGGPFGGIGPFIGGFGGGLGGLGGGGGGGGFSFGGGSSGGGGASGGW
jgi:uncharacterized protein